MSYFRIAFGLTMKQEGGYVNDVNDKGGETYKGIARKFNPNWQGWKMIDALKLMPDFPKNLDKNITLIQDIEKFYKDNYWDKFDGDNWDNSDLAIEMFDNAVNMGVKQSILFLQTALNVLNRNQALYRDLEIDGLWGKNTKNALDIIVNNKEDKLLLKIINVLQGKFYIDLCLKDNTQEKFIRGWLNRVEIIKVSGNVL